MPGVVMENGVHSNHDRDMLSNGVNGVNGADRPNDLSRKQSTPPQSGTAQPYGRRGSEGHASQTTVGQFKEVTSKMPPEINHIDEGFEQLPKLLTRLAQLTHNELSAKIEEMAAMGVPPPTGGLDDNTKENIAKKVALLRFLEKQHESWTKALVITNWSRVSEDIGKLIDVQAHITERRFHYDMAFHEMSELKRGLVHAKVPNPDFKTAVEVLSTGKASWMPDLGYIEPPRLTARELLRSLQNLNTLLSERLNLHDYDNIPYHFRNYSIRNGRVTFTVENEFEVDLTIADEDPEKQFWFIDFRFLFTPAVSSFKEHIRYTLESEVNAALEKDGLIGCYRVLHELTLTHKLSELRRQAHELARGRWIHTLQVEALHRGVSIQYWKDKYGENGPKSWIMLGPVSGKRKDGHSDEKATSRIEVRWFRDGKEVPDAKIPLNLTNLSTEEMIRSVIGLHVGHILRSIRTNLKSMPLFSSRELSLALRKSKSANGEPELLVQLTKQCTIKILIEHITGKFAISPSSRLGMHTETRLNSQTMDPAANGHDFIINLHAYMLVEETVARAVTVGWEVGKSRLAQDELKVFMPRDTKQMAWFRRRGWTPNWFLALSSGMSGESWFLVAITDAPKENATGIAGLDGPKVQHHIQVPTKSASLLPTYDFLAKLHIFTSSIICYHTNMLALHQRKTKYALLRTPKKKKSAIAEEKSPEDAEQEVMKTEKTEEEEATEELRQTLNTLHRSAFRLPDLYVPLCSLLPSKSGNGKPWAKEMLQISFVRLEREAEPFAPSKTGTPGNGLLSPSQTQQSQYTPSSQFQSQSQESAKQQGTSRMSVEAVLVAKGHVLSALPSGLLDKQAVDDGIAFNTYTDSFAFRLQSKVGEPIIEPLVQQLQRVSRLVDFVQVVAKHKDKLECERVGLNRLEFVYQYVPAPVDGKPAEPRKEKAVIEFGGEGSDDVPAQTQLILQAGNPHIRTLDHLTQILNDPKYGLEALAINLPMTLPVVRALDTAEAAWATLGPLTESELIIFARHSDDFMLRYSFTIPSTQVKSSDDSNEGETQKPRRKTINIELSQKTRQGKAWWWIRRQGSADRRTVPANDSFDKALREEVWSKDVKNVWSGQQSSAIARIAGAESMIGVVDAVMQKIAKDPAKYLGEPGSLAPPQNVTQTQMAVPAPTAPMLANNQPVAPQQQNQPQQTPDPFNRAASMQLKLPQKRPQSQTSQTQGPPQAAPTQRNSTVPVANMHAGVGGTPMAVSASMPGKPPSMGPAGPDAIQQGIMAVGRGKSMSPVMMKKAQAGIGLGGMAPGGVAPMVQGGQMAKGLPQGMNPQQVAMMRQIAQQQRVLGLAGQGGMPGPHGQMAQGGQGQQGQNLQGQQGQGGQGQGKRGGADAPMVID